MLQIITKDGKTYSANEEIIAFCTEYFREELGIDDLNDEFNLGEAPTEGMLLYNYRTNSWCVMVGFDNGERSSCYIDLDDRFTISDTNSVPIESVKACYEEIEKAFDQELKKMSGQSDEYESAIEHFAQPTVRSAFAKLLPKTGEQK